jgi:hypothetical protein
VRSKALVVENFDVRRFEAEQLPLKMLTIDCASAVKESVGVLTFDRGTTGALSET